MSDTDLQLLARYARHNAEDAFAEIVRRHLDLVFSAALRQAPSRQLAEEVVQSAFTDLARQARHLAPGTVLTAWLYQVTRRTAIDLIRREARRQRREQIASELNAVNATNDDWTHVEPLLDEAMHTLDDTDRAAILLRYFERKSLREVGETLGATEDAARKRVARAVEQLREFFIKRGITVGAGGLAAAISGNAVQAAPIGLAVTTAATASKAIALATVAGATAKSAVTLGSLGSLFAMLGGAFITLKAQADDTKSARERQFVVQMMGVRIALTLVLLAAFYGALKLDFSRQPIGHDAVTAAFLFAAAALATLSFDRTRRRQREIQSEEGTWVEAEWTRPRRETESQSITNKALRFMALGLVICLMAGLTGPWKRDPRQAALLLAGMVLAIFLSLRRWQNRPRFWPMPLALPTWMVYSCGITLLAFNFHQHQAWLAAATGTLPGAVLLFNLIVLLAYAAFIGIFMWARKGKLWPSTQNHL